MKYRYTFFILILTLTAVSCCTYFLFLRHEVLLFLNGEENSLLSAITDLLYPRLKTELARLSPGFFINKADQVVIRITLCLGLLSFLFTRTGPILPETEVSGKSIKILRILFYSGLIWLGREMYPDLISLKSLEGFYKPLMFLQIFPFPIPDKITSLAFSFIFFGSCILCILNIKPVLSSIIAITLFIFYQAFLYSFEKVEHAYATVNYSGLLMPFLLYQGKKLPGKSEAGFFLSLIMLVVAGSYLLSGLEKLFISGSDWLRPESFQAYLLMHDFAPGRIVAGNSFLLHVLPAAALLFQVFFITTVWVPWTRYVFLPAGIMFHWGTVLLFGISGFLNPWFLPYIFFVTWDRLMIKRKAKIISPKNHFTPTGLSADRQGFNR